MSEWRPISEAPVHKAILVAYQNSHRKWRVVKASFVPKFAEEADPDCEYQDYCEETDEYYTPEGWYEQIDNWDDFASVAITESEPTHFMPLPPPPETGR